MEQRIGPYVVLGELARGGMGVVLRGRDLRLGREVAIKLLSRQSATSVERFRREAAALSRLDHPGIVPVFEVGVHEGCPYLVMPLVQGRSLQARLDQDGPLPPGEAVRVLRSAAEALAYAHSLGLVHRDVKPSNVIVDARGTARLLDFGLVLDLEDARRLSTTGMILGTPGFLAPEQGRSDASRIGPRTDVYGLGATLYAALTGQAPFQGDSLVEVLVAQERGTVAPPSSIRSGVPAWLDAVCLKALAGHPDERYSSAEAFGAALARGETRPPRRVGLVVGLGVALTAVLALLAVVTRPRANPPRPPATPVRATPPPGTSPVPSASASEVLALARRAAEALVRKDTEEARRLAKEALARDPRCTDAFVVLANVDLAERDVPQALIWFDRALEIEPRRADLVNARGYVLLQVGELLAAVSAFQKAIELAPADAQAHLNLGLAYERLRDFEKARQAADQAVKLAPENPFPWNNRGTAAMELGDLESAAADFDRALELDPRCANALANRATLRLRTGAYAEALGDCDAVLGITPGDARARGRRGAALAACGRLDEALAEFDRSLAALAADDSFRPTVVAWRARALEHRKRR